MTKCLLYVAAALFPLVSGAATVKSPDKQLTVDITSIDGNPVYSVVLENDTILSKSPLGFIADTGDFSHGMKITNVTEDVIKKTYRQDKIKKSSIDYNANVLKVDFKNDSGNAMTVECRVSNNNVAVRYIIPRQNGGETGAMVINEEKTGFRFPNGTTTFLTPQSDAMIGWKRTKPSYEEFYSADAPMDTVSQFGHGYTFPALFRIGDKGWALLSETDVDGYYCASHLSDYKNGVYTIAYPMAEENNGNGSAAPGIALEGTTPWRTISIGRDLAPIVETTVMWDLVEPRYEASRPAAPGKGTWSWIIWQDASINFDDQKTYIDLAADMGYNHALIDNWWDTNIGREGIERLARYAKSKGVNIAMWYSSSGHWNDIVQGPTGLMDRPIVRKKEMQWLKDIGVKTIKVDFFGGDKQETMRLYEAILSDADDHGLMVIFHGCTLPRGWERMYPNYVGSEAVRASENMYFTQQACDDEAFNATLHPFIRNSVGCMEFGGCFMNKYISRNNRDGHRRMTSDAFQLATTVLFQNPVQNFAITPYNLEDAPAVCMDYLREVPTVWDETRFIEGYPGRYVVLARRHADKWYIAGVNATGKPVTVTLDSLAKGDAYTLYCDDADRNPVRKDLTAGKKAPSVTMQPGGGFVVIR